MRNGVTELDIFRVRLEITYLFEIENFLMKILYIKLKSSWNGIVGPINSTKKCNGTYE